jgi:hypothetical protein
MSKLEKQYPGLNHENVENIQQCIFQQMRGTSEEGYLIECKLMLGAIEKNCEIDNCPIFQTYMLHKSKYQSLEML